MKFSHFFEPEETVGALWHRLIGRATASGHPQAAVSFASLKGRLGVFYRGLGGDHGVTLKAIGAEASSHRLRWREKLGMDEARIVQARLSDEHLFLPEVIDALPETALNRDLYFWLTAWAVCARDEAPALPADPLQRDIAFLRHAHRVTQRVLFRFPGLRMRYETLRRAFLSERPLRNLPPQEAAVESCIRHLLGDGTAGADAALLTAILDDRDTTEQWRAGRHYRPFMPLLLWAVQSPERDGERHGTEKEEDPQTALPGNDDEAPEKTYKARRRRADQVERRDSIILHRFESVLSWAEMANINRKVEDEDEDSARKAADDMDEISLVSISKKAASRLKFDLDLSPEDAERERLAGKHLYPEWDYRHNAYLPDQCRVLASIAPVCPPGQEWRPTTAARRRIRAVKRQFEALRPRREILRRQLDGAEFDMDALIRSRCDFIAQGEGSNRIYLQPREQGRDLAVAVLIDISRSTESWVRGRQVIEIAREAMAALALGLSACGDEHALFAFSSLRRDRVFVSTVKDFDESLGAQVFSRIGALKPGFYTRLGAAIRHVSRLLEARPNQRRMLLVITDGKPNDLDHYEGRYGVEDTRRAIQEARQQGQAVFGVTIDARAQDYFPHIFGRNAYAITSHADKLMQALPKLYRQLVSA